MKIIMRNLVRAVIVASLIAPLVYASEAYDAENLRALMITSLDGQLKNDLSKHLQHGGMAESDALEIINVLVEDISDCTLRALVKMAEEQSVDPDTVLAKLEESLLKDNNEEVDLGLDQARIKEGLNYCIVIAFGEAGVDAPQIAP